MRCFATRRNSRRRFRIMMILCRKFVSWLESECPLNVRFHRLDDTRLGIETRTPLWSSRASDSAADSPPTLTCRFARLPPVLFRVRNMAVLLDLCLCAIMPFGKVGPSLPANALLATVSGCSFFCTYPLRRGIHAFSAYLFTHLAVLPLPHVARIKRSVVTLPLGLGGRYLPQPFLPMEFLARADLAHNLPRRFPLRGPSAFRLRAAFLPLPSKTHRNGA